MGNGVGKRLAHTVYFCKGENSINIPSLELRGSVLSVVLVIKIG